MIVPLTTFHVKTGYLQIETWQITGLDIALAASFGSHDWSAEIVRVKRTPQLSTRNEMFAKMIALAETL